MADWVDNIMDVLAYYVVSTNGDEYPINITTLTRIKLDVLADLSTWKGCTLKFLGWFAPKASGYIDRCRIYHQGRLLREAAFKRIKINKITSVINRELKFL